MYTYILNEYTLNIFTLTHRIKEKYPIILVNEDIYEYN